MKKKLSKKLNSKGAASIFVVMSILAAVLVIALGSSSVISTEKRMSLNSGDSVKAYYAAETGIEQAIYDHVKDDKEPSAFKCSTGSWTANSDSRYCLVITGSHATSIDAIQSVGEYKSTRRSIEISF